MRGTRKLLSIAVGCGVLLSIGITSIPTGRADTSAANALRARRAQLLQQLATLEPAKNSASSALLTAENAFASEQALLLAAQQRLAAINARLLALSGQITSDGATIVKAKQDLATLTRQSYESTTTDSWVAAVLSATSFSQAVDRLAGTSHVAEQVRNLQQKVRAKEDAISSEKTEIQKDAATTVALEGQLAQDTGALLMLVDARNAALQSASAPARAIENQIAEIDQQLATGGAPRRSGANQGSCGNHFAYGQCTWYVATRRCIPWVGNAAQWYTNAARMGYPVGHTPVVGAVVTFWPGGDGAGPVGHVGYVEAVGPAAGVPAGYFKFSEMNYNGWNRVNYRVLPSNSSGIQGFIYSK
ncbi:MAG: CHAP domain-containing protein [Candidatus Dormibacteraeota bacterium]|nr:CHAP domain-containing protein [Candidatus Dormibacteraeota bacterium]